VGRLTIATALLTAALASALVIPTAAQAAIPNIPPNTQWEFSGLTYPDTNAGLTACHQEGVLLHQGAPTADIAWQCQLGNPDAGVWNLWILFHQP